MKTKNWANVVSLLKNAQEVLPIMTAKENLKSKLTNGLDSYRDFPIQDIHNFIIAIIQDRNNSERGYELFNNINDILYNLKPVKSNTGIISLV